MRSDRSSRSDILDALQQAVRARRTNPYQIAKATGLPLRTVQDLLAVKSNTTLHNVETVLRGLGIALVPTVVSEPTIKPGTGRGHGVPAARRRGKG